MTSNTSKPCEYVAYEAPHEGVISRKLLESGALGAGRDMLWVAVRLYDGTHARFRALHTSRCNGLSMVVNRTYGADQHDRVDLFKPASALKLLSCR